MTNITVNRDTEQSNQRTVKLTAKLENLRDKVKDYAVLDRQGQLVGEVKDLIVDAEHRLDFVVCESQNQQSDRFFLLNSKLVEKIDSQNRHILTKIDKSEIEYLPEYLDRESQVGEIELTSNTQEANTHDTTLVPTKANDTNIQIEPVVSEEVEDTVQKIIRLLAERLVIDRSKRKVGEVIVRKQIETRMVEVPIRCEKLVVEQVSPEHKQLAQIDLGLEKISNVELIAGKTPKQASFESGLTLSGEFTSPKIASLLLNAIALEQNHGCNGVQVTIIVEDEEHQKTYQEWFDRTLTNFGNHSPTRLESIKLGHRALGMGKPSIS
ncbi:hypothetical protein CEN39_20170 [Fischerella thermalis CCMEE 5201]|jgi:stress response protein YsnF|nr:hypothetical protein CEN39_20170 [Fischerella thermalis CCMEE 5201]